MGIVAGSNATGTAPMPASLEAICFEPQAIRFVVDLMASVPEFTNSGSKLISYKAKLMGFAAKGMRKWAIGRWSNAARRGAFTRIPRTVVGIACAVSSMPPRALTLEERRAPLSTGSAPSKAFKRSVRNKDARRAFYPQQAQTSRLPLNTMKTIKVGLDGLSALDKVAKALYIEGKLTANPDFPTPHPPVADITAARLSLEASIAAALNGGRSATFAKNQAEDELDELIVQEAGYVVSIAGGDEAMILSAGFEVRKPASPIGPLPAPANLHADLTDQAGEILADWDPVHGAHEFEVQRNEVDPAVEENWKVVGFTTRSKYLDAGLKSGSVHWYRVRARGTSGDSPFSDPARSMAR